MNFFVSSVSPSPLSPFLPPSKNLSLNLPFPLKFLSLSSALYHQTAHKWSLLVRILHFYLFLSKLKRISGPSQHKNGSLKLTNGLLTANSESLLLVFILRRLPVAHFWATALPDLVLAPNTTDRLLWSDIHTSPGNALSPTFTSWTAHFCSVSPDGRFLFCVM